MLTILQRLTRRKFFVQIAFVLLLIVFLSRDLQAGNGTFTKLNSTTNEGVFNFCVAVQFNASTLLLNNIKARFEEASQILADATDNQHRFGTITFINNSTNLTNSGARAADFMIHDDNGTPGNPSKGAKTLFEPGGGDGYYGHNGEHVNMYKNYFTSNTPFNNAKAAYTIAHEFAHIAYNLGDEYNFLGGVEGSDECGTDPADPSTLNFCLMDNYWTRGGAASTTTKVITMNEFCVLSNHDLGHGTDFDEQTAQSFLHEGKSCWEVISLPDTEANPRPRRANAPTGLPVPGAPSLHTVTTVDGIGGVRIVLLLDVSASMNTNDRIGLAKNGAIQFVDLLKIDDHLGITTFSTNPMIEFPIQQLISETIRANARDKITDIPAFVIGASTNIGGALEAARVEINSKSPRVCNEIIVLFTDGQQNEGTDPNDVIPFLRNAGISVITIGVVTDISVAGQADLKRIADETGGTFIAVNEDNIMTAFNELRTQSSGDTGLIVRAPFGIASNEEEEIPAFIEAGANSAIFIVSIFDEDDDINLSLKTPSGEVITEAVAAGDPNIDFNTDSNRRLFEVQMPEAGKWLMIIKAGTVETGDLDVLALVENLGAVYVTASVVKGVLEFPEAAHVNASVKFNGETVVGANVSGKVFRPDGSVVPITLFDDGLIIEHGDFIPNDGIYSAVFNRYSGEGTYTFEIKAVNVNGTVIRSDAVGGAIPSDPEQVPPFERIECTTAVVKDAPQIANDLVTFDPIRSTFSTTDDTSGCPDGFVGKFSFDARLTNISNTSINNLILQVAELSRGNLLQNAVGGLGGEGAFLTIPNGEISPGESIVVHFVICLKEWKWFRFFVDVLSDIN